MQQQRPQRQQNQQNQQQQQQHAMTDRMSSVSSSWDALLEQSKDLNAGHEKDFLRPLSRSVHGLQTAGMAMAVDEGMDPDAEHKARGLLAQSVDTKKLDRDVRQLTLQAMHESSEPLGDTDIYRYLEHHHEAIVHGAIQDAKAAAERNALQRQREWEWEDWRKAKERLMRDLGQKTGSWSADTYAHSAADEYGDLPLALPQPPPHTPASIQSKLTEPLKAYALVVRALNKHDLSAKGKAKYAILANFAQVAKEQVPRGAPRESPQNGCERAWRLLQSMLEGTSRAAVEGESMEARKVRLAEGTVQYLAQQMRSVVEHKVELAMASGRLIAGPAGGVAPGLLGQVQCYVELLRLSEGQLAQSAMLDGLPLWPQVYWCLRCGGQKEALELVGQAVRRGVSDNALRVVYNLLGRDARQRDFEDCRTIYFRHKQGTGGGGGTGPAADPYRQMVLNLLVLEDSSGPDALALVNKIEGYMWFLLWFVVKQADMEELSGPRYNLEDLQTKLVQWGPGHFDKQRLNPWGYVLPLFMSQQFSLGVRYLFHYGLVPEAVHFSIGLQYHGVFESGGGGRGPDGEGGGDKSQALLMMQDRDALSSTPSSAPPMSDEAQRDFAAIVTGYAEELQASDPEVCVEYMLRLHGAGPRAAEMFGNAVEKLLLQTEHISILAGDIREDGERLCTGKLDEYLSPGDVQSCLLRAANTAGKHGRADKCIALYELGEDFEAVLRCFNEQLGLVLVPAPPMALLTPGVAPAAEERKHWMDLAKAFFHRYLESSGGQASSYVVRRLRDQHAGTTFQILLNLAWFFDMVLAEQWERAIKVLDGLDLLPLDDASCTAQKVAFAQLDGSVKDNFHHVIFHAMECLCHLHTKVKREWAATVRGSHIRPEQQEGSEHELMGLRNRASALVTFTGLLRHYLPADIMARVGELEVNMM